MHATRMAVAMVILGLLGGCGEVDEHLIVREHKTKAADMCKYDKGVKEILEANGANFTARCKSGIIVAGIAQL
ncbi:MAG: hypothetical protein KGZ83_00630 [Sulfuricella sp.]|nr:hypothetical protein [Sulfuricella sp.]